MKLFFSIFYNAFISPFSYFSVEWPLAYVLPKKFKYGKSDIYEDPIKYKSGNVHQPVFASV